MGVRTYPCSFTPRGLVVLDRQIRALSLEERAVAVALAGSGVGRESRLSAIVADLATEPESWAAGLDEAERAAIEAIALHLAGASGTGSLATTMVLACRELGWPTTEPLAMTALSADELAISVNAAGDDGESGWTAIVLEASDADLSAMSVFEARDHLARRLAQRADEPLDISSAEDSAERPTHVAAPDLTAASTPTPDRWGWTVATGERSVERHKAAAASVISAIGHTEPRQVVSHAASDMDGRHEGDAGDSAAAGWPSLNAAAFGTTEQGSTASRAIGIAATRWSARPQRETSTPTVRSTTLSGSPFLDGTPWWPEPASGSQPRPSLIRPNDAVDSDAVPAPRSRAGAAGVAKISTVAASLRSSGSDAGSGLEAIGLALDAAADLRGVSR